MKKLLIVEDEPLVQIGIRSMLNWSDLNIEICDIAKDGIQALDYIEKHSPEIIISDIKMPRMDGLELMKISRQRFGNLPVFIILTSYEEFHYLKTAMEYDVIDYLIKLELNQENLTAAINKALKKVEGINNKNSITDTTFIKKNYPFYDKFFIKLLLNLFDNEEEVRLQARELNLDFSAYAYGVCHCEIVEYSPMWESPDKTKLLNLYSSSLQMLREIIKKYIQCYVVSLDSKHFSIIFCLNQEQEQDYKNIITDLLNKSFTMLHNYFNVHILTSVGNLCYNPLHIAESYQDARQIFNSVSNTNPIVFYTDLIIQEALKNVFNMSLFREDIKKAFEEFDTNTLSFIFDQIIDIFKNHQPHILQSIDAACNILFLAISLLPDGEGLVTEIFKDDPEGYRSIYKKTTTQQVIDWLFYLKNGLCKCLLEKRKSYKHHIVANVKSYISSHINEKLGLQDVASVFGISPNYLSYLFKKYNDLGFNEYITQLKVEEAKNLMLKTNMKVYEIANHLGFENAFYFS
ncbi:MAG: response regulator, partial [Clostridiales bacterium]|nr:response regulator [Clostridiales bacterium]